MARRPIRAWPTIQLGRHAMARRPSGGRPAAPGEAGADGHEQERAEEVEPG